MAIEIIRKPTELFTIECEKCECLFVYNRHDLSRNITLDYVTCPCCREEIPHYKRRKDAIDCIEAQPVADVVEVRHGKWEEIKFGDGMFDYYFKCSNCGNGTPPKAFPVAPDYCSNCGAKMDGERREE